MNPLVKFLLKQIEDSAVIVERTVKASEKIDMHYETKATIEHTFNHFHSALTAVKHIVGELL